MRTTPSTLVLVFACGLAAAPAGRADDVNRAAQEAGQGAKDGGDAAAAALAAAQDAQRAINAAQQDSNAKAAADAAAKAAGTAGDKADAAVSKAEEANRAAKDAQAAQQQGDADAARAAADRAAAKAADAKAAAADASKAAADAKSKADAAESRLRNDQLNGLVTPPTPAEKQDLDREKQAAKEAEDQAKDRATDASRLRRQATDLDDEEEDKQQKADDKKGLVIPGEKRVEVPYGRIDSFFDVFIDLEPVQPFPNPDSPLSVPEVKEAPGSSGLLHLKLTNPNPFDVHFVGLDVGLFGDALSFTPGTIDTTIGAGTTGDLLLGRFTFNGPPLGYTFADFSLISDADHPGLGPEFSANFEVTPEPPTILGGLLAGAAVAGLTARRRASAARSS